MEKKDQCAAKQHRGVIENRDSGFQGLNLSSLNYHVAKPLVRFLLCPCYLICKRDSVTDLIDSNVLPLLKAYNTA